MNEISSFDGDDFDLIAEITDRTIPLDHRKSIRREMEKLLRFPYSNLVPPKKVLKSLGTVYNGTPLYELRPHCANKTQYRLPLYSPAVPEFVILGFFPRKDADFPKQIQIVTGRFEKIVKNEAKYALIPLDQIKKL